MGDRRGGLGWAGVGWSEVGEAAKKQHGWVVQGMETRQKEGVEQAWLNPQTIGEAPGTLKPYLPLQSSWRAGEPVP